MRCPACGALEDRVVDSRAADDGTSIRRRRQCEHCAERFTTFERVEEVLAVVVKRDGRRTPFDRSKIEAGVRSACKGRPVEESAISALSAQVEDRLSTTRGEVEAAQVGELVLEELRRLDPVAAVRFASVYKSFEDPEDFEREIQLLGHGGPADSSPSTSPAGI
ncbi:MAG: transcriptional repressor NrdR [Actinobacteria bacterium]|nr:transcriptional repressor NrdR [Actinomycetota bacterium]MSY78717.1 transcriptional repressor NrdR [Actinomycetota bacterium]MTA64750.1 transcriptional repressor NrdR [Actinomycetota bacterium]